MGLAAAIAGANRPSQQITWLTSDGESVDLTGATITGRMRNKDTNATRDISGTLTVTDATSGVFVWAYSTADVQTAGGYAVQFTATYAAAPTVTRSIVAAWTVMEAL
jgi:hypothetical protein